MTMVERVAQIIAEGVSQDRPSADIARAAIEAMREPTEEMIYEAFAVGGYQDGAGLAPDFYRAMIDAALKE